MAKTVGDRIRQARLAKGWSGETLAKLAGYSKQSSIGNLENRATGQGGNRIGSIAGALGVSADWLLHGPDSDQVPFLVPSDLAVILESPKPPYHFPPKNAGPRDPWIAEAAVLLSRLSDDDRRAAVLWLRAFVHTLGPPRDGHALSVAV